MAAPRSPNVIIKGVHGLLPVVPDISHHGDALGPSCLVLHHVFDFEAERCDLVVWEVEGVLTGGVQWPKIWEAEIANRNRRNHVVWVES